VGRGASDQVADRVGALVEAVRARVSERPAALASEPLAGRSAGGLAAARSSRSEADPAPAGAVAAAGLSLLESELPELVAGGAMRAAAAAAAFPPPAAEPPAGAG